MSWTRKNTSRRLKNYLITNRQKNKLIKIRKKIKAQGGMNEEVYKEMYPTGTGIPKFMGFPRSIRQEHH